MTEQLIGRSSERGALDEAVATLQAGPCAVVLEGDAGIGKTSLWDDARRRAARAGVRVLVARSTSSESAYAFAVLGDLVAPVLEETLGEVVPVQRRALEVALALRDPHGSPPDARVLGLGLLAVLRVLLRDGPVLLALDDVQWADPASVEVLTFALRRVRHEPVGVLLTVRGHPVETPLGLDRSPAAVTRLAVEPLALGDLHRLLHSRLGLDLPRPALVHVHTITGGNPFYALELGRGVVERGLVLDDDLVALPDSLVALMAQRLQVLPARTHETLVAVAALAAPAVSVVEGLGPDAVADVDLAAQHGLVALDGDRIRFTHPLLASACYSAVPLHHRRRIHRRLAALPLGPEEVARHLALAATGPDEEIALALDRAARHAAARGAVQVAADLAERAVSLTPSGDLDAGNRRRIDAAHLCRAAGDLPKARAMLQHAADTSDHGPVRARALSGLASVRSSAEGFRMAENLYLAALDEPGLDPRERVSVLCDLAWAVDAGGSRGQGSAYAAEALAAAELDGDPEAIGHGLVTVAELEFWRTGRIHRDLLDRAVAIERMTGRDLGARSALARSLGRSDRHPEARALFEELIAEARDRDEPAVPDLLFFLARAEIAGGDWAGAERHCDEADDAARQAGEQSTESLCRMMRAEIAAYRGDERARQEITDLLPIAADTGFFGAVHRLSRALGCLELSLAPPRRGVGTDRTPPPGALRARRGAGSARRVGRGRGPDRHRRPRRGPTVAGPPGGPGRRGGQRTPRARSAVPWTAARCGGPGRRGRRRPRVSRSGTPPRRRERVGGRRAPSSHSVRRNAGPSTSAMPGRPWRTRRRSSTGWAPRPSPSVPGPSSGVSVGARRRTTGSRRPSSSSSTAWSTACATARSPPT